MYLEVRSHIHIESHYRRNIWRTDGVEDDARPGGLKICAPTMEKKHDVEKTTPHSSSRDKEESVEKEEED